MNEAARRAKSLLRAGVRDAPRSPTARSLDRRRPRLGEPRRARKRRQRRAGGALHRRSRAPRRAAAGAARTGDRRRARASACGAGGWMSVAVSPGWCSARWPIRSAAASASTCWRRRSGRCVLWNLAVYLLLLGRAVGAASPAARRRRRPAGCAPHAVLGAGAATARPPGGASAALHALRRARWLACTRCRCRARAPRCCCMPARPRSRSA